MSDRFTKVYESILDSSIWFEDSDTRCVWVTMMALADANGVVENTLPGLSRRAFPKPSLEEAIAMTSAALKLFSEPDEHSRTKDDDGRRVREVPGGWFLINHKKYRDKRKADDRREQNREAQQRHRDNKQPSSPVSRVSKRKQKSAQAEAEANLKADPPTPPTGGNGVTPPDAPTVPSLRDVARVFRKVTGHDLPNDIDASWREKPEREPLRRMLSWCAGDLTKLERKLSLLAGDEFLSGQPITTWASRIGTNPKGKGGSAPAPEDFDYANARTRL